MRGYLVDGAALVPGSSSEEGTSEDLVVDAVGTVIEFWGFKRSQGRVWALLYLRDRPLTAAELQKQLQLSKGGISTTVRELEQWGIIRRVRIKGERSWFFTAEKDFIRMISGVVKEREFVVVRRIAEQLNEALALARNEQDNDPGRVERIERLYRLAKHMQTAVEAFLQTEQFDIRTMRTLLTGGLGKNVQKIFNNLFEAGSGKGSQ